MGKHFLYIFHNFHTIIVLALTQEMEEIRSIRLLEIAHRCKSVCEWSEDPLWPPERRVRNGKTVMQTGELKKLIWLNVLILEIVWETQSH